MSFDLAQIVPLSPMLDPDRRWAAWCCSPRPSPQGTRAQGLMWLSVAGCVAALVALVVPVGARRPPAPRVLQGMWVTDRMSLFIDGAFVADRAAHRAAVGPVHARARLRVRRVLRPGAVRRRRHDDGGARRRTC